MAELTDETVAKLNSILGRLASGGGGGGDGGGAMGQNAEEAEEAAGSFQRVREELEALENSQKKSQESSSKFAQQMEHGTAIAEQYQDQLLGVGSEYMAMTRYIPKSIGAVMGMAKAMFSFKGVANLVAGVLRKVISNTIEHALAVDKTAASFRAATGAGYGYERVISNVGKQYRVYGINADEAGAATQSLYGTFSDFTKLSAQAKEKVAGTAAVLSKFGISADETAQNMNTMTKSLGMSVDESERTLRDFESIARSIGKPMSEISKDFASAAPKLAFYGKQAVNVFKNLEAQSKSTGLSVDQLIATFGDQFDTFEGSATAVGKLNALLGGPYLNSIDMLNASEDERLEMMQQSLKSSGILFDDLNKFEKKAFASAIGTDVDTLSKSLRELSPFEQAQILRQEQLARKAGQARDIITKLKDAFAGLLITNQPLIDQLHVLVDKLSDWMYKNVDLDKILNKHVIPRVKEFGTYLKEVLGPYIKDTIIPIFKKIAKNWKAIALGFGLFKAAPLVFQIGKVVAAIWGQVAAQRALGAAQMGGGGMGGMGRMARMGLGGLAIGAGAGLGYGTYKGVQEMRRRGASQGSISAMGATGGAASGALIGAGLGSFIPGVGTLIGAGVGGLIGGGVGYFGAQNDATQVYHDGKLAATGNSNSSDNFVIHAGTPTGPLARNTDLFGNSGGAGGSASQAQMMRQNVTLPLIKALREMNLTADVRIEGDMSKLLDVVNTPRGKQKWMPSLYSG